MNMNGIDLSDLKTQPTARRERKQTPVDIYLKSASEGNPMRFAINSTTDVIGYVESVDEYNILLSDTEDKKILLYKSSFFKAQVEHNNSDFPDLKPSTTKMRPNQQLSEWMEDEIQLNFKFKNKGDITGTIYNITTFEVMILENDTNELIILPKQNISRVYEL